MRGGILPPIPSNARGLSVRERLPPPFHASAGGLAVVVPRGRCCRLMLCGIAAGELDEKLKKSPQGVVCCK